MASPRSIALRQEERAEELRNTLENIHLKLDSIMKATKAEAVKIPPPPGEPEPEPTPPLPTPEPVPDEPEPEVEARHARRDRHQR